MIDVIPLPELEKYNAGNPHHDLLATASPAQGGA
jgi:hypothetical protein